MNQLLDYRWSDLPRLLGLALAYAVLAKISLDLFSANGEVSIVWPSSGLALAAMLIGGKKYWPAIFIGALAGNIIEGNPPEISIFIAAGNTLGMLTCFWLLTRIRRFNSDLTQPSDFLWLGFAATIGSCVSAMIGVTTLLLVGSITKQVVAHNLLQWWQGVALGVVLVTPLILVWRHLPHGWFKRDRVVETLACFGLAFFAGQVIFLGWFQEVFGTTARGFWMFLFVTWGAVRFSHHGTLLIICMTAIQMLAGMILTVGGSTTNQVPVGLLNFWFYILALTVVGIALSTTLEKRKRTEETLEESERRFRFLNVLGDATRILDEPTEILTNITQLLGKHLSVSRCAYADVETDGDHFTILHDYTDGCASTMGNYSLSLFGSRAVSELHAGRTFVVNDVDTEVPPGEGDEMFNAIQIKAVICCPLIKQGTLRAMMAVHQTSARTWTPSEISLVEEVVERCWAIIERARAEKERNQTEERIVRLSKLYKALSETNQAIVRMERQAELFPLVCRCAVEFGGMKMAWIGQVDEMSRDIVPVASYGDGLGYVENLKVSADVALPEGRGPAGTALRENRSVIVNDYSNDPITSLWQAQAVHFGWNSGASFPVQRNRQPFAVLCVYHANLNAFDEEAIALLNEMSTDISFALDNFDRETRRKAAEESLRLAASVYETSSEAMTVTDANGFILTVNPAFTKITGYLPEEVIGKSSSILGSDRHDEAFYQAMWQDITTTGHWQGEIWDKRKNGEVYAVWLTINTIFNEDGTVHRRVSLFSDATEWKKNEELIWRQANFDPLTDLPNRQMFYDRLDQDLKKAHRTSLPLALMFLDLDRFKEINDTLGHDMGDVLLKEAAQRLSSCVRETDTVARLGGDEFTVILSELDEAASVDRVARNILRKLSEPFQLGEEMVYVSASIGVTLYPEDATESEALIKNADQAMYAAKNQGRNRYSYFTSSMQEAAQKRMQIANDLRGALAANQFWVAYQPIVELATGIIHKAEALIRWQHPTQGLISPATFIPVAEDTGLIVDIGNWVFREAAHQAKRWRASLHPAFQISVNKSPVQFHHEGLTHLSWYEHLQYLGLPGQSITVEITEGLLLDANPLVTERLIEFRDEGIQVSIDDFGTGYSALSYLKKFDIDYLKIDQSFVRNLTLGSEDMALCEAIIVMAHKLDMKVIAEGVETEEQKDLLLAAGCDYGQGYLFSKPVLAQEFELLLQFA